MNNFLNHTTYCTETVKENIFTPIHIAKTRNHYYKINPVVSVNTIKSERIEKTPLPATEGDKTIYSVQVGLYSKHVSAKTFLNIQPLYYHQRANGKIAYYSGVYSSYLNAEESRNIIRQIGITDAFVVAFKNGRQIPVTGHPHYIKTDSSTFVLANQNCKPQDLVQDSILQYAIQLGVYSTPKDESVFMNVCPLYVYKTPEAKYVYSTGIYKTIQQAKWAKQNLYNKGMQ